MPAPPKPWERAGAGATGGALPSSASFSGASTSTADASSLPAVPDRPASLATSTALGELLSLFFGPCRETYTPPTCR